MTSANLHLTVEQAAKAMNVSRRMVYDAIKLRQSGRHDLVQQVEAGTLSIHRALILAGLKAEPDRLRALCTAWNACTEVQRLKFVEILKEATR